jgi:hypothetical protein
MSTATVTMAYSEFQALQETRKAAEEESARLKAKLMEAKIEASDPRLLALSRAALEVVRYAVSSLPPESNRGWPFEALMVISEQVPHMPDASPDNEELALTLKVFAKECEDHERRRALLSGHHK